MDATAAALRSTARWTRVGIVALFVLVIGLQVSTLFGGPRHMLIHGLGQGWIGAAVTVLHGALMLFGLYQLLLLLGEIEKGELFSSGVTRPLRTFALCIMVASVMAAVVAPLIVFFMPDCDPSGVCRRRLTMDMRGLLNLIISLVFFLVARLLDEARRIEDDNRQII